MKITDEEINNLCDLINDLCGIYLDETKGYLIEGRLSEIVDQENCNSFTELARLARHDSDDKIRSKIVDAITTNETLFFRDQSPFEALQHKIIPELIDSKENTLYPNRIRIWSAACSTGQEPYSLAAMLNELIPDIYQWDISILATDISDKAIETASRGVYHSLEIQRGMDTNMLNKHFVQQDENHWKVKDELRGLISFQQMNLLDSFKMHGPFDIVMCRNVAIYFTPEVRENLFDRITQVMTKEGHLIVGCSESLADLGSQYTPQHHCGAVIYRPNLSSSNIL